MLSPGENRMQSIVGTWKLLHATARDAAGAARPLPYGGNALGRVTFTADGRRMSVVCDGRKELPAGVSREYSSYCGNYTYDGSGLSRALTPRRTRPGSAAIRCAGCASWASAWSSFRRRARPAKARNTGRSPGSASRRSRFDQEPEVRFHLPPAGSQVRTAPPMRIYIISRTESPCAASLRPP
jgi:hypothetical protein